MFKSVKVKFNKYYIFVFLIFCAALFIRIVLVNWTLQFWNNGDLSRYEDWARVAHIYNFADTYTTTHLSVWKSSPNNQPPGSLYILSGTYELWILVGKIITHITHTAAGSNLWVNTILQHIFMKSAFLLTDILMGIVTYFLVAKEAGKRKGLFAAALILFNPIIFYNSAIWGQMDSINNLFFILSLFFAFRKKIILSVFLYACSLYIKLSLLPLLPFYLIFLFFFSEKNIKKIIVGIILSLLGVVIATLPISPHPIQWLFGELPIVARGETNSITAVAFNFWYTLTCLPMWCHIPDATETFLQIPLSLWAYGLFGVFSLPLLFLQIKKPQTLTLKKNITQLLALVALLVFLFLPKMHDRYMYPVFPLLAIAIGLSKNFKTLLVIYFLLMLFHLENLIYSWFPTPLKFIVPFYALFYDITFRWIISLATVVVGGVFYIKSLRSYFH